MKKSLVIVAIALAFVWAGFPSAAQAEITPPMQGVLAVVDGTESHVTDIWLMPSVAAPSSIAAGPADLAEFVVTSSTGVYDAAGKPMATDHLWRCVGSSVKAWSHVVASRRVADRISLDAVPGQSATPTCAHALSGTGSTVSDTAATGSGIGGGVSTGGGSTRSDDSHGSGNGGAGSGAGNSSAAGGNGGNNGGAGNGGNGGGNGNGGNGGGNGNGGNGGGNGNGGNGGGNGNGGNGGNGGHGNGADSAGAGHGQGSGLEGDKPGTGHQDKQK